MFISGWPLCTDRVKDKKVLFPILSLTVHCFVIRPSDPHWGILNPLWSQQHTSTALYLPHLTPHRSTMWSGLHCSSTSLGVAWVIIVSEVAWESLSSWRCRVPASYWFWLNSSVARKHTPNGSALSGFVNLCFTVWHVIYLWVFCTCVATGRSDW